MATGRTTDRWTRVYINGYDMSGMARNIGPLEVKADEADVTTLSDAVKVYLPNMPHLNVGTLSAVFDNTATTGIHTVLGTAGTTRTVLVAKGIRGVPAAGDPIFGGEFLQTGYQATGAGAVLVEIPFAGWPGNPTTQKYSQAWGQLVHALGAETAANTGTGFDNYAEAATTKGGYFIYHITTSNAAGTATVSVDDSADNAAFLALSGATSGAIGFASIPAHGIVALGNSATVRRYLRWQIALAGGMTTCTFVSAFIRIY